MGKKAQLSEIRVSILQTDLLWHAPAENRTQLSQKLATLKGQTDLIVLPEMFTSGFTIEPDTVSHLEIGSPTLNWMTEQAKQLNAALCGSTVFQSGNGFTNRLWFVTPEQSVHHYDKVHLFRMGGENERYQAGNERCIVEYRGWKLLLTICYDLRFPVFCRNRQNEYDVMVCVANWPSARRLPWRTLLTARAIENQSYVVGVNRIGKDGRDWHYSGDSLAVDYFGRTVIDYPENTPFLETTLFSRNDLDTFRDKFPTWMDADDFTLSLNPSRSF
ncbi:amidohydrolase [Marinibactrum halimedae]|uniref:Omega-amidase YafV n=1 Tax=Marinibactrum halimedae TaxID=1444977 RepID=A0AA37WMZ2_9GAMM|nr:amidohydrolase [Marinibactrum halimedae]MCD9459690.1 amidohydrolase [Marinibactrum halimedae]GLS25716.1 amidohydrolase [Marinibactrum halimedae]